MNNKIDNIFKSKEDFEIFLKTNEEPIVVIIGANWCGCCQIMIPVMEKIAREFEDKMTFITVKSEDLDNLELNFDSEVLPKILLFNNGKMIDQVFGTASFEFLEEKMKTMLAVSSQNNMDKLR
jgi:thioredoxin-like negative regulator of GroEL